MVILLGIILAVILIAVYSCLFVSGTISQEEDDN